MTFNHESDQLVVVTGGNGLVGARICAALAERGATVRAMVRRVGTAPHLDGVHELVGDFTDPSTAAAAVAEATAVVTTVHPLGGPELEQRRVAVEGTRTFALAARAAGVPRLVHVSTSTVYRRSPGGGDVTEASALVGDDAGPYPTTKRDADAALARITGITRVLVRPPAVLGPGPSSVWNTLRPGEIASKASARRANHTASFPWVHVTDLAALTAALAVGAIDLATDPEEGPVLGECTVLNAAAGTATQRDYLGAVCSSLGVEPEWTAEPSWAGRLVADRARRWGWRPRLTLAESVAELRRGLLQPM